jgi:hypothetical protein
MTYVALTSEGQSLAIQPKNGTVPSHVMVGRADADSELHVHHVIDGSNIVALVEQCAQMNKTQGWDFLEVCPVLDVQDVHEQRINEALETQQRDEVRQRQRDELYSWGREMLTN